MSLLRKGWGAYARDKNTSVRVCAKNAGGAYARGGGVLFAGHYGTSFPAQFKNTSFKLLCDIAMSAEQGGKAPYSADMRWRMVWQHFGMELTYTETSNTQCGSYHCTLYMQEI